MGSVWDSVLEEAEDDDEEEEVRRGWGASGERPALPVDGNGLPWERVGRPPGGLKAVSNHRNPKYKTYLSFR
jgi:hypothetical protein